MEIKTKQRLVGILVLLAILAIFLPVLFHTSRPSVIKPLSIAIPPRPTAPKIALPKATTLPSATPSAIPAAPTVETSAPVASKFTAKTAEQAPAKTQIQPVKSMRKEPVKLAVPAKKKQPVAKLASQNQTKSNLHVATVREQLTLKTLLHSPKAWVVQLAAFANKDNADHLITKLRNKGFDAYVRPITEAEGKRLYRVYVGPEIRLDSAQKLRTKLQASYHLHGVVRKYKI